MDLFSVQLRVSIGLPLIIFASRKTGETWRVSPTFVGNVFFRCQHSLESVPGLLKSLKIPSLAGQFDNPIPTPFLAPLDQLDVLKFQQRLINFKN